MCNRKPAFKAFYGTVSGQAGPSEQGFCRQHTFPKQLSPGQAPGGQL